MNEEQILNGRKRLGRYSSWIPFSFIRNENDDYTKDKNTNHYTITKDKIKSYIFMYIDYEIFEIKNMQETTKLN
jgi:hypothetical protein